MQSSKEIISFYFHQQKSHANMVENIKKKLSQAKYIACTSDIWSKDRRAFIAINAHWIDSSGGELKSVLLACDRFKGSHTGIEVENKIKSILIKYDIHKKVVAMTTDNASNYKCAFERNGDDYQSYSDIMAAADEDELTLFQLDLNDSSNVWCPTEELLLNDNNDVIPLADSISNVLDPSISVNLPSRSSCAAHTLNLIGKVDSFKALSDKDYRNQYVTVFSKLNMIWKHSSTRLGREIFKRYLNDRIILKPHRIRWNRIYDAVFKMVFFLVNFTENMALYSTSCCRVYFRKKTDGFRRINQIFLVN